MPTKGKFKIRKVKVKGKIKTLKSKEIYWECANRNCGACYKPKYEYDGTSCKYFEDKYENNDTLETWRKNVALKSALKGIL